MTMKASVDRLPRTDKLPWPPRHQPVAGGSAGRKRRARQKPRSPEATEPFKRGFWEPNPTVALAEQCDVVISRDASAFGSLAARRLSPAEFIKDRGYESLSISELLDEACEG